MNKGFVTLLGFLALANAAYADRAPGRSLPSGENSPWAIEEVFASPVGEVQFLESNKGHTVFLRGHSGNLFGLQQVRGSDACKQFVQSTEKSALPTGCEFVLRDDFDGRVFTVRSEEMRHVAL